LGPEKWFNVKLSGKNGLMLNRWPTPHRFAPDCPTTSHRV
jgi:hypothetical protein